MCCIAVSSKIETFHFTGELFKTEGKQLKIAPVSAENWPDSVDVFFPRVNNKDGWESLLDKLYKSLFYCYEEIPWLKLVL